MKGAPRPRLRRPARTGSPTPARVRIARGLGAPALFAIAIAAVGSSVYFALGLVAGDALGLTPVVFLLAGAFFVVTMMTYVEANSLHPERGGASTFARYAFNELWSFIAGWAIVLDYVIVMAIGAISIPHYLGAFWGAAGDSGIEQALGVAALAFVAWVNVRGLSAERLGFVLRLGLLNLVLSLGVVVVGLALVFDPGRIVDSIDLGAVPAWDDLVFAAVIATVALTGIEAASGLAGEIRVGRRELRRVVFAATAAVLLVFVGMSIVALMAVPVVDGATELGGRYLEAPVLGVVSAYDPSWAMDVLRYAVGGLGALLLLQAVNMNMLGLSRLTYSLATNRQIPAALGKLHAGSSTPYVAIAIAAVAAAALVMPADLPFLAGIFAFGAMLAFTIAHVSVVVLRFREPEAESAYRVPGSVRVRGVPVPLPAVAGAGAGFAAWVRVLVLHEGARVVGGIWMLVGLALYVGYRMGQDASLTQRFTIPAEALREVPGAEYGSILVPVLGTPLDDDIVGTAGRLASEEGERGEGGAVIEALYVVEVPMALPLDARIPDESVAAGRRALARAKEVGEEYDGVEVATAMVRGRTLGAAIVDDARRRGVAAIALAAEEPTRMRGGALLGGRGGPRDRIVGEMTKYVMEKAPCRVVLTAPPAGKEDTRAGVRP